MKAFISHTTSEAPIAQVLKNFLQRAFPGKLTVFVSTDVHDLTPGDIWLNKIETVLKESSILLVICSPSSLTRPWIHFEAGCGWMRGASIVPICHSGQLKDQLPHPFSELQALQLEDDAFCNSLLEVFVKALGVCTPEPDIETTHKRLERAKKTINPTEALPQIITSERERTKLINNDLKTLLASVRVAQEVVWTSAFLSTFAIGNDDPYPESEQDYLKLLLQERELLLKLARKGCIIRCVISPANRNYIRHAGIGYGIRRTERLLEFLRSGDKALKSIDWAISELGVKNLYVIGHISCFEGYKSGVHRGYGLTLRQTSPEATNANIILNSGFFRNLTARTLLRWGSDNDKGDERELLRAATIRCLEESKRFLLEFSKAMPAGAQNE